MLVLRNTVHWCCCFVNPSSTRRTTWITCRSFSKFSPRPLGFGMHFQSLLSPLLKMPRMVLLSSLLCWELGTNLPGEWLSFWHVTSKQFWFWFWCTPPDFKQFNLFNLVYVHMWLIFLEFLFKGIGSLNTQVSYLEFSVTGLTWECTFWLQSKAKTHCYWF